MKSIILTATLSAINTEFNFLPNSYLLLAIFFLVGLDFLTGVLKSKILGIERTSKRYRETLQKFIQYGGAILIAVTLSFMIKDVPDLQSLSFFSTYINNIILMFIMWVEVLSNLENLTAIDTKSPISKWVFQPLKNILTFQLNIKTKTDEQIISDYYNNLSADK